MESALKIYSPDFVVFNGDNIVEEKKELFLEGTKILLKALVSRNIPYGVVFGNHDAEYSVPKEYMMSVYSSIGRCLTTDEAPDITGMGNCVIPVYSSICEKPLYSFWLIDSNAYEPNKIKYDHVHEDQLDWMISKNKMMEEQNGYAIPSMVFQHIPLPEIYEFLIPTDKYISTKKTADYHGQLFDLSLKPNATGHVGEPPCPANKNSGELKTLEKMGNVKAILTGHDHSNSFTGHFDNGIDYIQCAGLTVDPKWYGDNIVRG